MSLLKRLGLVLRSFARTTGERIDRVAAEEELREAAAQPSQEVAPKPHAPETQVRSPQLDADCRYLGLTPTSDLPAIEAAWRRLASRADPKRFPPGSDEEKKAAEILKSLNEAYYRLREALNPTEGRFGRLEL